MALTFIGKVTFALIIFAAIYFAIFIMPGLFRIEDELKVTGRSKVKLIAFVKTFDERSAEFERMLKTLAKDPEISEIFTYEIIVVDVEKELAKRFAITEDEAPCFIIGNEKFSADKSEQWLKQKILSVAKAANILNSKA